MGRNTGELGGLVYSHPIAHTHRLQRERRERGWNGRRAKRVTPIHGARKDEFTWQYVGDEVRSMEDRVTKNCASQSHARSACLARQLPSAAPSPFPTFPTPLTSAHGSELLPLVKSSSQLGLAMTDAE